MIIHLKNDLSEKTPYTLFLHTHTQSLVLGIIYILLILVFFCDFLNHLNVSLGICLREEAGMAASASLNWSPVATSYDAPVISRCHWKRDMNITVSVTAKIFVVWWGDRLRAEKHMHSLLWSMLTLFCSPPRGVFPLPSGRQWEALSASVTDQLTQSTGEWGFSFSHSFFLLVSDASGRAGGEVSMPQHDLGPRGPVRVSRRGHSSPAP